MKRADLRGLMSDGGKERRKQRGERWRKEKED